MDGGAVTITRGRPRANIDRETLERFRSLKFTWSQIGSLMGTSGKTVQRRAKEFNIQTYSSITDAALDALVKRITSEFPNSGEVMVKGHLLSQKVCESSLLATVIRAFYSFI